MRFDSEPCALLAARFFQPKMERSKHKISFPCPGYSAEMNHKIVRERGIYVPTE